MNQDSLYGRFAEPSAEYRGKPFWAWNGCLEETELKKQIEVFKEMGFGGFFMHSRTGLETEYLGDEWFRLIDSCTIAAKKSGMESWIYDEDRWPSGSAGGLATEMQEYRASFIRMHKKDGYEWNQYQMDFSDEDNGVIAAFACSFCENILLGKRKIELNEMVSEEESVLVFSIVQAERNDVYNGNTYLDTMNPDAVAYYLKLTHEKYAEKVPHFQDIQGVFTDEPHRGPLFTTFNGGREDSAPYTAGLFDKFYGKYGYHLENMLPELFFLTKNTILSKVTYDYIELCQELFLESYAEQISDWCKKHQLLLTGHVLHEDSLMAQTIMQGSLMRFYPYMDYPGVDVLLRDNHCYWIVKQVVSVARQMGNEKILSELYGATGWQTTLEDYKNMGDWQALFGINLRCQHLSLYTLAGESKRDYPASIFSQLSDYKAYRLLEDYFSRIHVFMEGGTPDCHILVIHPVESVWARSYSGAYDFLTSRDNYINQLEEDFEKLFWTLVQAQVDFDYGDEALLAEYGYVENGILHIGHSQYTKVIVSGMLTMRSSTCSLLKRFKNDGGEVLFIGKIPDYIDAIKDDAAKQLAKISCVIPFDPKAIENDLSKDRIVELEGEGRRDILVQSKVDLDERRIILWNQNLVVPKKQIELKFTDAVVVEEWNPQDGTVHVVFKSEVPASGILHCNFAPGEMKLYRLLSVFPSNYCRKNIPQSDGKKERAEIIDGLGETVSYELSEPNVCVLDRVTVKSKRFVCNDQEVLRADQSLRKNVNLPIQTGEMLQPWYQKKYKPELSVKSYPVELCYEFEIQDIPDNLVLAIEPGKHPLNILVNGKMVLYEIMGDWIDSCLKKINIPTDVLKIGSNQIKILDTLDLYHGIESVFLLGDFGVEIQGGNVPLLKRLPKDICFRNLCDQGFPFYSGKVRYLIPEMLKQKWKNKKCRVILRNAKAWGMKLIGDTEENISWAPYEGSVRNLRAIEVTLTRKNTFGPLHQKEASPPLCGPESFRTIGEDWSNNCVLQAQGLLQKPEIIILSNVD